MESGFTSQQAMSISGLSRRQLTYWRNTGLVVPSQRTDGGHWRYTFLDLLALKTAKKLIEAGVSVQKIRKSIASLLNFLPTCTAPLRELSLVTTGDIILVLHGDTAFEALTGQEWILPVAELELEIARLHHPGKPQQVELFPDQETRDNKSTTETNSKVAARSLV
ncbi:MAG TPA: MerR family transcriptional regulator [Gammaproteobacteria bacterium]|nr:MerR family transcriptional regulator [Gammaproteobacteria bacterium]